MPDANGFANEGRMRRIRRTLATTDYVPSYGGFRLSVQEPTMGIHFVPLEERHRNMIRQLIVIST
jgi:hypothetical protein